MNIADLGETVAEEMNLGGSTCNALSLYNSRVLNVCFYSLALFINDSKNLPYKNIIWLP